MDPLFSRAVADALARGAHEREPHRVARLLARSLPADVARRAAELHALRLRAAARFGATPPPYLTARGLEQASHPRAATWRAGTIARALAPDAWVLDATAGIGSDAIALARAGLRVVAADRDPLHASCAAANFHAAGLAARVLRADAEHPAARADVIVLDPDRRPGGRRSLDPARWSPPLDACLSIARRFAAACIQLAPAFDPTALAEPKLPHRWTWTSVHGQLHECTLWTGALAPRDAPREAIALGRDGSTSRLAGEPCAVAPLDADAAECVRWIADPDPAVVRSGLLGRLARERGLAPLGPQLGYLGGAADPSADELTALGALARPWRVLASAPADPRRVRAMLREHDVGRIQVGKRGHPDAAEVLERRLRGPGGRTGHVLIARLARGHRAYLVEPARP